MSSIHNLSSPLSGEQPVVGDHSAIPAPTGPAPGSGAWKRLCTGKWVYLGGPVLAWVTRQPDKTFECRYPVYTGKFHYGVEGVRLLKANQPTKTEAMRWVQEQHRKSQNT